MLTLIALLACTDNDLVALQPAISVHPSQVVFEDLVLGEPAQARVQIGNAGRAPLVLDSLLVGSPFDLEWTDEDLAPGEVTTVTLLLQPDEEADHEAELAVLSNDPEQTLVLVPVSASPRAPWIAADPEQLVWASSEGGLERLHVGNDGEGPLRIHALLFIDDGGGVFSLSEQWLPDLMAPHEESYLDLSALPSESAGGTLRILSNDPVTPVLDVPLQIGASVQECPDDSYPPETVELDDSCVFDGLDAVWDPVIETAWRAFPTHIADNKASQPFVGRITDDDGDGDVDGDDPPDLCVWTAEGLPLAPGLVSVLRVLDTAGDTEHWSVTTVEWEGVTWYMAHAAACSIGDIDGDGSPEIVVPVKQEGGLIFGIASLDNEGNLEWLTEVTYPSESGDPWRWLIAPALADLEGDGSVEVIVGRTILAGSDGTVLGEGTGNIGSSRGYPNGGPLAMAVDLDNDGIMEVLAGPTFMAPDGSTLCEASSVTDGYPAAADLDNDWDGEVVITGNHEVVLLDHHCTVLDRWPTPDGGAGGPATLADFDGDGDVEIGVASKYYYYVFETDGAVLWSSAIRDESSHSTGSAVFDFDGDGSAEVVFADEYDLFVLDGVDGRVRFLWTGHASGTGTELPVIADVDDDGSAEIVLCHGAYRDLEAIGCTIVGSESSGWMPARPVWNQHAFSMSHIEDDLSIPSDTSPNWPELNTFRSADTLADSGAWDRNARPALVEVCNLDCEEDNQRVVVRVENPGLEDLPAGIRVDLRATLAGTETTIAWQVVEEPIPSGSSSAGLAFDVDLDLMPERDLVFVVDPYDVVKECDEEDNRLPVNASLCP